MTPRDATRTSAATFCGDPIPGVNQGCCYLLPGHKGDHENLAGSKWRHEVRERPAFLEPAIREVSDRIAARLRGLKYLPHDAIQSFERLAYNTAISDAIDTLTKEDSMSAVESLHDKQRRAARLQHEIELDERIFDMLVGVSTVVGEWTTAEVRNVVDSAIERYLEITDE